MKTCSTCGVTENETRIIKRDGDYFCRKHYLQLYRHGRIKQTIYDKNNIRIYEDYAEIELRNMRCDVVGHAMIDLDDVDKCSKYKWHIKRSINTSYAITSLDEYTKLFLHRLILAYNGDMDVDHINMNGLDNRKSNLRIVSHSGNLANNSKKGVKRVASGKWQASICYNYKTIYIGTFDTEDLAFAAREAKRLELRG